MSEIEDFDSQNVLRLNRARNLETREAWQTSEPHRKRVTEILLALLSSSPKGSAGILGAGNCNDIDLGKLCAATAQLHLVDLDTDAVKLGVQRQEVELDKLQIHASEIAGLQELALRELSPPSSPTQARTQSHPQTKTLPPSHHFEPVDVIASLCVFTQIVDAWGRYCENNEAAFVPSIPKLQELHLRSMLAALNSGGRGLFVTDVVSSATWPTLAQQAPAQLPSTCRAEIAKGNFFVGTNPASWYQLFQQEEFAQHIAHMKVIDPWLWNPGPRIYAVYGIQFVKV